MKLVEALENRKRGGVIKNVHLFEIYDSHFGEMQEEVLNILEIGVYNGGSLYMWQEYFKNAKITGIDIDPYCKQFEGDDIKIYLGDQADREFLEKVDKEQGPFDIIIDDGGHEMKQQIISFNTLFPLLKDGGVYVIEDTYTSYQELYDCDRTSNLRQKFDRKNTTMEMLKGLCDKLQVGAYREGGEGYIDAGIMGKTGKMDYFEENVFSVHFYDSICFINKAKRPKLAAGGKAQFFENK